MEKVVIFCASSTGKNPKYKERAEALGVELAKRNITIIYGGAKIGLMGHIADACLDRGGKVVGIIPEFLTKKEVVHTGLSELIVTKTMHERKRLMIDKSEGCIALPGGFGTLEELFELLTDAQLGLYSHPIGLLNVNGYYDNLIVQLKYMVEEELLRQVNLDMLIVDDDISKLLFKMNKYVPSDIPKWL